MTGAGSVEVYIAGIILKSDPRELLLGLLSINQSINQSVYFA